MTELERFEVCLREEEKSPLTVEKYLRDAAVFLAWLNGGAVEKRRVLEYKAHIMEKYATASVNSMLSSVNAYLAFIGRSDCRVKTVKRQRQIFSSEEKELSRAEYGRLLAAAAGKPRLWLLMQTICSTGIRVSEHRFITVEAAKAGVAEVRCKGKLRPVLLPRKLCKALLRYAKGEGIASGSIFITRTGRPMDRSHIWAEMKKLCADANVPAEKVFPHNLRHLFARTFYSLQKDIVRLADILGHASINTTRIYTMESGAIHRRQIEKVQLLFAT